ncbi:MAG: hypothetical protein LBD73_00035 [Deferribacteraceae bacterium]|jgi:hypothetical protein|nr:hypothetical protein [Deferribacteraceae bacterium]
MRKVEVSIKYSERYEVIKKLVKEGGNKECAVVKPDCSGWAANRLIKGYKSEGKLFLFTETLDANRHMH